MDEQTDGGRFNISRPGPLARREIKNFVWKSDLVQIWFELASQLDLNCSEKTTSCLIKYSRPWNIMPPRYWIFGRRPFFHVPFPSTNGTWFSLISAKFPSVSLISAEFSSFPQNFYTEINSFRYIFFSAKFRSYGQFWENSRKIMTLYRNFLAGLFREFCGDTYSFVLMDITWRLWNWCQSRIRDQARFSRRWFFASDSRCKMIGFPICSNLDYTAMVGRALTSGLQDIIFYSLLRYL